MMIFIQNRTCLMEGERLFLNMLNTGKQIHVGTREYQKETSWTTENHQLVQELQDGLLKTYFRMSQDRLKTTVSPSFVLRMYSLFFQLDAIRALFTRHIMYRKVLSNTKAASKTLRSH